MKNTKVLIWVMVALFMSAPVTAQIGMRTAEEQVPAWQTGTMKGSGSSYSSQVTPVGSQTAYSTTTTTTDGSNASGGGKPGGPRRVIEYNEEMEGDDGSPIGDAVLPMIAFALVYCGVTYLRRRRNTGLSE